MNILIVEDAPLERKRLERLVREAEPDSILTACADPVAALNALNEHDLPDIVFLDIEMPVISGIELAEKLKQRKNEINIIFTTAYTNYMQDAFDLFASGYLLKPFSVDDIRKQLSNLRYPINKGKLSFYAQTAGSFEFFCNGRPVAFGSARAKETLAYLVDRCGASVSKKELFAVLFEDSSYTANKQDYMKKIIHSLKTALAAVGGENILIHNRNSYSVDTSLFSCDLYEAIKNHREKELLALNGYMAQYSWAEGIRITDE